MKTFIQLSRYGDIINLLPACKWWADQGEHVRMIVHRDFVDIFEGVSYVEGVGVDSCDVQRVASDYPDAIVAQVDLGNPRQRNFTLDSWDRTGCPLDLYDSLPLVFDRRVREREPRTTARLGFNFQGVSSRFNHANSLRRLILRRFPGSIDLGVYRCHRIYDLLGVIESLDLLVTLDTATLHLANASRTPCIVLSRPDPYLQSEGRAFWIKRFTTDRILSQIDEFLRSIYDSIQT